MFLSFSRDCTQFTCRALKSSHCLVSNNLFDFFVGGSDWVIIYTTYAAFVHHQKTAFFSFYWGSDFSSTSCSLVSLSYNFKRSNMHWSNPLSCMQTNFRKTLHLNELLISQITLILKWTCFAQYTFSASCSCSDHMSSAPQTLFTYLSHSSAYAIPSFADQYSSVWHHNLKYSHKDDRYCKIHLTYMFTFFAFHIIYIKDHFILSEILCFNFVESQKVWLGQTILPTCILFI